MFRKKWSQRSTVHLFKLTNGFRFGIYSQKDLIKQVAIHDPSIFAFSLNNKIKNYPKSKENVKLENLFNNYLFKIDCIDSSICVYNNCLGSDKIWINYKMSSNSKLQELCGLYKDENTCLLDYEVF